MIKIIVEMDGGLEQRIADVLMKAPKGMMLKDLLLMLGFEDLGELSDQEAQTLQRLIRKHGFKLEELPGSDTLELLPVGTN